MHGSYKLLHVSVGSSDDGEPKIVHVRSDRMASHPLGSIVRFDVKPDMLRFFDPATGTTLMAAASQKVVEVIQ
jgi:hypothetical protein